MKKLFFGALISGLAFSPAFAGGEKHQQQQTDTAVQQQQESPKDQAQKHESIEGEILQVKDVKVKGGDNKVKVVLIETEKGNRVVADLGHDQGLKDIKLEKGQKVSLEGEVVSIGDRNVFAATSISQGDKSMDAKRGTMQAQEEPQKQEESSSEEESSL